jgi:hypothetical protein
MKTKIGYKVVACNNNFYSCTAYGLESCVKYKLNKFIYRKKKFGALAVFDNLKYVNRFIHSNIILSDAYNWKIFKCEYIPSKLNYLKDENGINDCRLLEGARFAEAVKLLEEIKL